MSDANKLIATLKQPGKVASIIRHSGHVIAGNEYLAAYARFPTDAERRHALEYLQRQSDARRGLEDLAWALLNSREFLFNH